MFRSPGYILYIYIYFAFDRLGRRLRTDLGALGGADSHNRPGGCFPCSPGADGEGEFLEENPGRLLDVRVRFLVGGKGRAGRGEIGGRCFGDLVPGFESLFDAWYGWVGGRHNCLLVCGLGR